VQCFREVLEMQSMVGPTWEKSVVRCQLLGVLRQPTDN